MHLANHTSRLNRWQCYAFVGDNVVCVLTVNNWVHIGFVILGFLRLTLDPWLYTLDSWFKGFLLSFLMAAARTSFEPALARLETLREQAVLRDDLVSVERLDAERDALLEKMYKGLSKMTPCANCESLIEHLEHWLCFCPAGNVKFSLNSTLSV